MCCDEFMKLITCLCIVSFGYFCSSKKEGSDGGGEYMAVSEGGEKSFDEESEADDDGENSGVAGETDNQGNATFLGYLRQELQFDWRMVRYANHSIASQSHVMLNVNFLLNSDSVFFIFFREVSLSSTQYKRTFYISPFPTLMLLCFK